MRHFHIALLSFLSVVLAGLAPAAALAEEKDNPSKAASVWQPAVLPLARQASIKSDVTGRTYRIQIGKIGPKPEGGYPVVYVLDGDAMFPMAFLYGMALAMQPQDHAPVSLLVVGIGYSEKTLLDLDARAADYTPPSPDYEKTGDGFAKKFGEADRFLRFLDDELKPMIAKEFPVDNGNQTLLGHSYGALFTLYTLYTQPESFRNYVASSPSIWWNNGIILTYFEEFKKKQKSITAPLSIRISSGSLEETPSVEAQGHDQRMKMLNSRKMVSNAQAMAKALTELGNPNIQTEYTLYPQETHGSVILRSIADGISHVLGEKVGREK